MEFHNQNAQVQKVIYTQKRVLIDILEISDIQILMRLRVCVVNSNNTHSRLKIPRPTSTHTTRFFKLELVLIEFAKPNLSLAYILGILL